MPDRILMKLPRGTRHAHDGYTCTIEGPGPKMWRLARQVGLQLQHSTHQSSSPSTFVSSSATENMFIL